jgi:hypothetical protein
LRIGTKVIHEYISTCPLIFIYLGAYFIETTGQLEPPHRSAAPHSAMFPFAPTPLPVIAVVFSPLAVHKHLMKRVLLAVCRRDTLVRPPGTDFRRETASRTRKESDSITICNSTMNHSSCDVDVLTVLGASATFQTLQHQEFTFGVKTTSVFRTVLVIDVYVQVERVVRSIRLADCRSSVYWGQCACLL